MYYLPAPYLPYSTYCLQYSLPTAWSTAHGRLAVTGPSSNAPPIGSAFVVASSRPLPHIPVTDGAGQRAGGYYGLANQSPPTLSPHKWPPVQFVTLVYLYHSPRM